MSPLEEIRRAQAARLVSKDGDEVKLELEPPLPPAEIEGLPDEIGAPLPLELRTLLGSTAGIEGGPLDSIDFTGRSFSLGAPDMFPAAHPIAGDGFGNFWILDLGPDEVETASVFFVCHDPPVVLYQSPNIATSCTRCFGCSLRRMPPRSTTFRGRALQRLARESGHARPLGRPRWRRLSASLRA